MKKMVFYSWQKDTSIEENKLLIQNALEAAIREVDLGFVYDEAERGAPGPTDIFGDVRRKIDRCAIFVPDLTLVTSYHNAAGSERHTPNPNVLIEYGYAHAVGDKSFLPVFNTAYGSVETLPFDLKGQRIAALYELVPGSSEELRAREEADLTELFIELLKSVEELGMLNDGLSKVPLSIARIFAEESETGRRGNPNYFVAELAEKTGHAFEDVGAAVDTLEGRGWLEQRPIAGSPGIYHPTNSLFIEGDKYFFPSDPRDPKKDARQIAEMLVNGNRRQLNTQRTAEEMGWSARRMNPAVAYLEQFGLVRSSQMTGGGSLFIPRAILETSETRRFVRGELDPESFPRRS